MLVEAVCNDELMCAICHELMERPIVLPSCGHSYCKDCLQTWLVTAPAQQCCVCKADCLLPLPAVSKALASIIDVLLKGNQAQLNARLKKAVQRCDVGRARSLLGLKADPNFDHCLPYNIHHSGDVQACAPEIAMALIDAGVTLDASVLCSWALFNVYTRGWSGLGLGWSDVAMRMLQGGAGVGALGDQKRSTFIEDAQAADAPAVLTTTLSVAIRSGWQAVALELVRRGCPLTGVYRGKADVSAAAAKGYHDVVAAMLARGAKCNPDDKNVAQSVWLSWKAEHAGQVDSSVEMGRS
jgi:hypothetical protein